MERVKVESSWAPEVEALLERLVVGIRDAVGLKLVGVYVYGSLTLGDFDLDISDVDLLAAVASDLTKTEFETLLEMHESVAREHPAWAGRIEVQYASLDGLKTFREKRSPMAVISPGEPFHLIDAGTLALVRPTAFLINTCRGPVVDEAALEYALVRGRLAGAALDVFEQEPLPPASGLRSLPNCWLAPHNANSSVAAAERVHERTLRSLIEALGAGAPVMKQGLTANR